MKLYYDNLLNSSFLLWLNNYIQTKGEAYINTASKFYDAGVVNGKYVFSSAFSQHIYDSSITGAVINTGIYLNNSFNGTGSSGFLGFNYERGQALFSSYPSNLTISGSYSIPEFNTYFLSNPEFDLLFETKFNLRPKVPAQAINQSGLATNTQTYPAIFICSVETSNEPLSFGGQDSTKHSIGAFILSDSALKLDTINGILRDSNEKLIPLFPDINSFPLNIYGGIKYPSNIFNYNQIASGLISSGSYAIIDEVNVSYFKDSPGTDFRKLNPNVYYSVVDFTIKASRFPRI